MKNALHMTILTAALSVSSQAAIIFSPEAAGVQYTTRTGVLVETFDSLPTGPVGPYVSAIGTYSAGGVIQDPNAWGGSDQTRYIAVGAQSAPSTVFTLNFGKDLTYFGLYWGAGDGLNVLEFYDGTTLVGSFSTSSWAPGLSSDYWGNPNNGQNTGEKYAFLNFDATGGTKFDSLRFVNTPTSTGFETDSHTIMATSDTPEPATWAMMIGAAAAIGFARKRRLV